jgi:hypothetical protein
MEWNNVFIIFMAFCTSITYKNELVYHISRIFEKNLVCLTKIFVYFFCSFNVFSFDANKDNLLHVTHCTISLVTLGQNSFISKLFQMSCH